MAIRAEPLSITILSDYPIDTQLNAQTLNANVLDALARHGKGRLSFNQQVMPQSRAWKYIERNDACIFNQMKTAERERKAIFTHFPLTLFPPVRLIVSKDGRKWPAQFDPIEFNLPEGTQIGIVSGHSYGHILDRAIATHPQAFFSRSGTESTYRLNDMLMAGRVEGVLNYVVSLKIYLDEIKSNFKFSIIPIKGLEQGVAGYLVCSPSEGGKAMAQLLDSVFASTEMQAEFLRFHREMYVEEEAWLMSEVTRLGLLTSP